MQAGCRQEEIAPRISAGSPGTITLLFDLNGMLVQLPKENQTAEKTPFRPRPGFQHVLSLLPHFRLGLYTSCFSRTMNTRAAKMLEWLRSQPELKVLSRSVCSAAMSDIVPVLMGRLWLEVPILPTFSLFGIQEILQTELKKSVHVIEHRFRLCGALCTALVHRSCQSCEQSTKKSV